MKPQQTQWATSQGVRKERYQCVCCKIIFQKLQLPHCTLNIHTLIRNQRALHVCFCCYFIFTCFSLYLSCVVKLGLHNLDNKPGFDIYFSRVAPSMSCIHTHNVTQSYLSCTVTLKVKPTDKRQKTTECVESVFPEGKCCVRGSDWPWGLNTDQSEEVPPYLIRSEVNPSDSTWNSLHQH